MKIKGTYNIPVFSVETSKSKDHPWENEFKAIKPNAMYVLASASLNNLKKELQQQGWVGVQIVDGKGRKVK